MTSLEDPTKVIAQPGGYFLAPWGGERIGDVSNVLFSNGWIADEDGKIFIYYASNLFRENRRVCYIIDQAPTYAATATGIDKAILRTGI